MELAGKTVIVAGGAGSIGAAVVAELTRSGAQVAIIDMQAEPPPDLAPGVPYLLADAADDQAVAAAIGVVIAQFGKIHALVNCTGLIHSEALINIMHTTQRRHSVAAWNNTLRSNLSAAFVLSAHVAEHFALMRTRGVLVHLSSISATGNPGQTAYSAAKAGVEAMVRVWARELGPLGIRAVAIAPGFVDTPSTRAALAEPTIHELTRRTPLRRLASVAEICSAVVFALENDFLTGVTIALDGGLIL